MILPTYNLVTHFGKPVINFLLKRRCLLGKENPERIEERRGVPSRSRPNGALAWIHAASVGEALSALPLIERLKKEYPDFRFLITTGTVTSAQVLQQRLPRDVIHQFIPVDRLAWVEKFLSHWRPNIALWIESEFWPNLLTRIRKRNIPMILINGRISENSRRRWRRLPGTISNLLGCFTLCLAQSETDADNLRELGALMVSTTGNIKFAADPLPANPTFLNDLKRSIGTRPVWLAASTHPGEEKMIIETHHSLRKALSNLLTIIVPRHPDRGPEISALASNAKLVTACRSKNQSISDHTAIYISDTIGELGTLYRIAPVSFIGGSMVAHGGQNMLEAAKLGSGVIFGPHTGNFKRVADQMIAEGAAHRVVTTQDLINSLISLLSDKKSLRAQTEAGLKISNSQKKILDDVIQQLRPSMTIAQENQNHAAT
ncbi:MAG: 3-deoxy-D-manno-octulosonic acid transferase [Rhodospirillaceae bacterium]